MRAVTGIQSYFAHDGAEYSGWVDTNRNGLGAISGIVVNSRAEIVNAERNSTYQKLSNNSGYSLWTEQFNQPIYSNYPGIDFDIDTTGSIATHKASRFRFQLTLDFNQFDADDYYDFKIGSLTSGTYFCPTDSWADSGVYIDGNSSLKLRQHTDDANDVVIRNPDLGIKMSTEYDGHSSTNLLNGSTITNFSHTGPPDWGDVPAWTLQSKDTDHPGESEEQDSIGSYPSATKYFGTNYKAGKTSGRRVWDLSYRHLGKEVVFTQPTQSYSRHEPANSEVMLADHKNMSNFFRLTMNGKLPFIFCPNIETEKENMEFAICVIDQDSLQFNQVAPDVFNVSMKIKEIW